MARCFLLEVNNRGVGNHLLNTINPPRFLCASLLKGLVIPDSLKKKSTALAQVQEKRTTVTQLAAFSVCCCNPTFTRRFCSNVHPYILINECGLVLARYLPATSSLRRPGTLTTASLFGLFIQ